MKKPCSEMFCLRNQDITDAKAFFYLFFMSNSGYLDKFKYPHLSKSKFVKWIDPTEMPTSTEVNHIK